MIFRSLTRVMSHCAVLSLLLFGLLAGNVASGQMRPPWYNPWVAGGAGDQMSPVTGQHSGLVGWQGLAANGVQDTAFAAIVQPPVQMGVPAVWVFGQCFGGGMFDELNALGGTQSGVSATTFNQPAFYPLPGGNGQDFVFAYIRGMAALVAAQPLAAFAAANDPFGPNPAPVPARMGEPVGAEQPWYLSVGAGANNLVLWPQQRGIAILWSGQPEMVDRQQMIAAINQLLAYGYQRTQIFVLYGSGVLAPTDPLAMTLTAANPPIVLRAATQMQLANLFNQAFGPAQQNKPNFIFFLANDHGFNTAIAGGNPVPKEGEGGGPVAEEPYPGGYGGGNGGDDFFPPNFPGPSHMPSPTPIPSPTPGP